MRRRPPQTTEIEGHSLVFSYGTLSAGRLTELQAFIDDLDRNGKLSQNATYRKYIEAARYRLPDGFGGARSLISIALYVKLMHAAFHLDSVVHDVLVPPQYYGLGLPKDALTSIVRREILPQDPESRLERLQHGHLKLLAVRSGLADYGRNNITYVPGMGSFLLHAAYATDAELPDDWSELSLLRQCEGCRVCLERCPTGAIRESEFVIDAAKCIPLYNEVPGDFPAWLPSHAHNATIGCMSCQLLCPANREAVADAGRFPDIGEQETRALLGEADDAFALSSAGEKLRIDFSVEETLQTVRRNLRVLLRPA